MNKAPARDKIGQALQEVMRHRTVRGTFGGVHQDLQNLGVTAVVVGENEVEFVGKRCNYILRQVWLIYV